MAKKAWSIWAGIVLFNLFLLQTQSAIGNRGATPDHIVTAPYFGYISGKVSLSDNGTGVNGIKVYLTRTDPLDYFWTYTDNDGTFSARVATGTYTVTTNSPIYPNELGPMRDYMPNEQISIVVSSGITSTAHLILQKAAYFYISAFDQVSNANLSGYAVGKMYPVVEGGKVISDNCIGVNLGTAMIPVGTSSAMRIRPGVYKLHLQFFNYSYPNSYYHSFWHLQAHDVEAATPITLTSGELTAIQAKVNEYEHGWIIGNVTDQDTGLPISGVFVHLNTNIEGNNISRSAFTDANGSYQLKAYIGKSVIDWYSPARIGPLEYAAAISQTVIVTPNQVITVNQQLKRIDYGTITGRVYNPETTVTVSDIGVNFRNIATDKTFIAETDAFGLYKLLLPPGNYQFTGMSGYMSHIYTYNNNLPTTLAITKNVTTTMNIHVQTSVLPHVNIVGTVRDARTQLPIKGAKVEIYQKYFNSSETKTPTYQGITDDHGNYVIANIKTPANSFFAISAAPPNDAPYSRQWAMTPINSLDPMGFDLMTFPLTKTFNFELQPKGVLRVFTHEIGSQTPVAGIKINASTKYDTVSINDIVTGVTDQKGILELPLSAEPYELGVYMENREYRFHSSSVSQFFIQPEQVTQIDTSYVPYGDLAITVDMPQSADMGLDVYVIPEEALSLDSMSSQYPYAYYAHRLARDLKLNLRLSQGKYAVLFKPFEEYAAMWHKNATTPSDKHFQWVQVNGHQTTTLSTMLHPAASISFTLNSSQMPLTSLYGFALYPQSTQDTYLQANYAPNLDIILPHTYTAKIKMGIGVTNTLYTHFTDHPKSPTPPDTSTILFAYYPFEQMQTTATEISLLSPKRYSFEVMPIPQKLGKVCGRVTKDNYSLRDYYIEAYNPDGTLGASTYTNYLGEYCLWLFDGDYRIEFTGLTMTCMTGCSLGKGYAPTTRQINVRAQTEQTLENVEIRPLVLYPLYLPLAWTDRAP